jgi:hypothetical protein
MPNWGEQLGGALSNIAKGVQSITDPEFEFRRQLEHEMITNPELVQHLADLEFQSPGAVTKNLRAMLTPGSSGLVTAAAPSMNARIADMMRRNTDLFVQDPTLMRDIVSRLGTGQTTSQRAQTAADASIRTTQAGAVRDYATQAPPTEIKQHGENLLDPTGANIEGRFRTAQLRLQYAQTPAEKMAARMEYARYAAQLGLGNSMALLDARFQEEAQRARPEWINALRGAQRDVSTGITRYNANPNDADLAILTSQVQSLRDYYRVLGETPPDINIGTGRGSLGIGRRRVTLVNASGEEVDPMSINIPAITQTAPTGSNRPNRPNRPARPNQPAATNQQDAALRGRMQVQAAALRADSRITDASLQAAGWSTDQIVQLRHLARTQPNRRSRQ